MGPELAGWDVRDLLTELRGKDRNNILGTCHLDRVWDGHYYRNFRHWEIRVVAE